MKNNTIIGNIGHFDNEIEMDDKERNTRELSIGREYKIRD